MSEIVGHGEHLVGIQVSTEPANLAGGAANAEYLAARLALGKLARTDVRVLISDYGDSASKLVSTTNDLLDGGVGMIIAPRGAAEAKRVAGMMEGFTTLVSTSFEQLSGRRVFSAGVNPGQEALAIAGELRRRSAKSVALIGTAHSNSTAFVRLMSQALMQQGIASISIVAASASAIAAELRNGASGVPDALVFATPPDVARRAMSALSGDARLAGLPVFGPTDWALSRAEARPASCLLPVPKGSDLAGFAGIFRQSYGVDPTLSAAIVHDLAILAGALPQVAEANPYSEQILFSPHGFSGVTGGFVFKDDRRAARQFTITRCP